MKIFIILTIILILIIIITMIIKSKKIKNVILEEETKILSKYFGEKITDDIKDLESLQNSLDIKQSYKKELEKIVPKVKHDHEILYTHNINLNKAYPDSFVYNIIVNTVVSYSMRNNISIKKGIKLLLLTMTDKFIQEQLTDELSKEEELENFYTVLESFIKKYNDESKDS
ncbi:MAG: hypothetical protein CL623_10420 [Arcobacter sp.]|nr:hypothetical protein [Arcobacter sp.]